MGACGTSVVLHFGVSMTPPTLETQQVVLTLPRALVRTAEWIERAAAELHVEALEDDALLVLCDVQMGQPERTELSSLLTKNREGRLDKAGKARLDERMREYDQLLLRKAQALREAAARDLRGPMGA